MTGRFSKGHKGVVTEAIQRHRRWIEELGMVQGRIFLVEIR